MQKKGYSQEFIEQVKTANNIIDVARTYMTLKQKGQDFWGCCPFHSEKTPSFKISNTHQMYYCFGCRASGNVISLVMQMDSLSWREALEHLAKRANIELPQITGDDEWNRRVQKKEKILGALLRARDFYCKNLYLEKNKAALAYLHGRGIDDELIKLFHIGYSDSWQGVIDELKRGGYTETEMKDAGIAASSDKGRVWDAQFERITFAIHDIYGNCIGFTGRTMSADENIAKYKNTAETMVFAKSNIVYGIDVMKEKTRGGKTDGLIVVEGNVDEIAMIKHGFYNTVACMGTALTPYHAKIFSRFGSQVYLCLDGDSAGQAATLKSIDVLRKEGLTVRVVPLRDKENPDIKTDPDDFLKKYGANAMRELLKQNIGSIDFKLDYAESGSDLTDNVGKGGYLKKAVEILSELDSPAEREFYIPKVANALGVPPESVRASVNGAAAKTDRTTTDSGINAHNKHNIQPAAPRPTMSKLAASEKFIIAALLHKKPYAVPGEVPRLANALYQRTADAVIAAGDKWNMGRLYDEMESEELQMLEDVINYPFNSSDTEQMQEWYDDIICLKEEDIKRQKAENESSGVDDAAKAQNLQKLFLMQKEIQKLKEKKNG